MRRVWSLLLIGAVLIIAITNFFFYQDPTEPHPCDYDIVTCSEDSQCGESGFYGEQFCIEGDVWQPYYATSCSQPGTCYSACNSEQTQRLVKKCSNGCSLGRCT